MHWVRTNISSIYYFTKIPIILKQHIQSDWITNELKKTWGDSARDYAAPSAQYAWFCWWTQKIWMTSLITMFAVRPICVQDSIFKMSSESPGRCSGNPQGSWTFQALTDVFQYEQTHNMMQVWTGKLSELQLPVQNPAREGACTSMSY